MLLFKIYCEFSKFSQLENETFPAAAVPIATALTTAHKLRTVFDAVDRMEQQQAAAATIDVR